MATLITVNRYGFDGSGRTVKQATEAASAAAREALSGPYRPVYVRAGDIIAVGWREPQTGWNYSLIHDGTLPIGSTCLGTHDREAAERQMRQHVAQLAWPFTTSTEDHSVARFLLGDRAAIENHDSGAQWQQRYKAARANGADDDAARDYASDRRATLARACEQCAKPCELHRIRACGICHRHPGECDYGTCTAPATSVVGPKGDRRPMCQAHAETL